MSQYWVYILYAPSKDIYYVGFSHNVQQRIDQHKNHFYPSNATKKADDWQLFWKGECASKAQALKIEKHIKSMKNRKYYHNLKQYNEIFLRLKDKYA